MKEFKTLQDVMSDYEVPKFFKRATGRKYGENETCINDIKRMLLTFVKEKKWQLVCKSIKK